MSFRSFQHLDVPNKWLRMINSLDQVVGEGVYRRQGSCLMLKDVATTQWFVVIEGPFANGLELLKNG